MTRFDDLQQKERQLVEKEDTLISEKRQLERVTDMYDTHFYEARQFFDSLCYSFHQNNTRHYFESMMAEFSQQSRNAMVHLEEGQEELMQQKRNIQQQLDEISEEKRKAFMEERGKA